MALPLESEGNPGGADEYESEALSILSRFNEGALQLCEDESLQREVACGMVRQCFEFWFNTSNITEPEKLAFALLDAYKASYPMIERQEIGRASCRERVFLRV